MSSESEGRAAAEKFRDDHGLGHGPLEDMIELVSSTLGIDVLILEAGDSEHGLTMADPDRGTLVIAVAATPYSARQRSSIAHEMGHYLWRDEDLQCRESFEGRGGAESRANAFARHLLMPLNAVAGPALGSGQLEDTQVVSRLTERFDVSPHLAAIQLKEAGRISVARCAEFALVSAKTLATRYGWLDLYERRSLAASRPQPPRSLLARATEGYLSGVVALTELADWAGKSAAEMSADLDEAGLIPFEAEAWEDVPDDPFPAG